MKTTIKYLLIFYMIITSISSGSLMLAAAQHDRPSDFNPPRRESIIRIQAAAQRCSKVTWPNESNPIVCAEQPSDPAHLDQHNTDSIPLGIHAPQTSSPNHSDTLRTLKDKLDRSRRRSFPFNFSSEQPRSLSLDGGSDIPENYRFPTLQTSINSDPERSDPLEISDNQEPTSKMPSVSQHASLPELTTSTSSVVPCQPANIIQPSPGMKINPHLLNIATSAITASLVSYAMIQGPLRHGSLDNPSNRRQTRFISGLEIPLLLKGSTLLGGATLKIFGSIGLLIALKSTASSLSSWLHSGCKTERELLTQKFTHDLEVHEQKTAEELRKIVIQMNKSHEQFLQETSKAINEHREETAECFEHISQALAHTAECLQEQEGISQELQKAASLVQTSATQQRHNSPTFSGFNIQQPKIGAKKSCWCC